MYLDKFLLGIVFLSSLVTEVPTQSPDTGALNRSVALTDFKGTSADAVASLLTKAEVPGGVVSIYEGCTQPEQRVFSLQGATLSHGLDYISSLDGSRKWIFQEGVVVVGSGLVSETPLSTVLGEVVIDSTDSLSLSTQKLLESVEVRQRIKKIGLVELNTPLGLSGVSRTEAGHPQARPKPQPIHLNGKRLEQVLNILASSKGKAVWHYEQFVCDQKTSFRISWLVH
jgi:hypothetical protein